MNVMELLTAFVALAIFVSGLDDLFIDCCYYGSRFWRRLFPSGIPKITEADLIREIEKPMAVMIPAWNEHQVIGKMLKNNLRAIHYSDYHIFVGTYPNDPLTLDAVAEAAQTDPRVHHVILPHNGPTNKADCLNWIIRGIRDFDKERAIKTGIYVLHDSEDLIHPLSFKLMNYFIPRFQMVQLPVIPMETRVTDITSGTYLDEFAESHIKDMRVREILSGMVPSAGVATAFSSEAVESLIRRYQNRIFNTATFTEDYDLGFRLRELGGKSALIQFFVDRKRGKRKIRELVGTREYFPSDFRAAVRQKSRWTLGIVFHGWRERGWEGGPALRYMIWRDRKTLLTNLVNMTGYCLLIESAINSLWGYREGHISADSWIWSVLWADMFLLANRCAQRMIILAQLSGWRQAALSLPRIVWGNIINFCAVAKASHLFIRTELMGKKLVWAKTEHVFPADTHITFAKEAL